MAEITRRRRGAELDADLLDAAMAELAVTGYAGLTMEGVAARARTGKQVLYRRWPNRAALVRAAIRERSGSLADDPPDTGTLRGDVLAVLERMVARMEELGAEVLRGLAAEAPDIVPSPFVILGDLLHRMVERAAARGEIPTADLPERVFSVPINLLRHDMIVGGQEITAATPAEIVDQVFLPLVRAR